MRVSSLISSFGLLAAAHAQSKTSPVLETNGTVLAVFIYHNHCDRTSFYQPDGGEGGQFGAPGATMCYQDGTFYWNKYLREASDLKIYGTSQIYNEDYVNVEVPNVDISVQSATAFMQGIFKPVDMQSTVTSGDNMLAADNSTFMNGPLQGYQYTPITTYRSTDPQSVWVANNILNCKNQQSSMNLYFATDDYKQMFEESQPFFTSLYKPYFEGVVDADLMVFFSAYSLYDYVNQNRAAGNETLLAMPDEIFQQLRVYANHLQFNLYANTTTSADTNWSKGDTTEDLREMGGRLMAGKISRMLQNTLASGGWQDKFNFVLGSYDIMLSFFALANLTSRSDDFYGLPDLGSSMVFELYTDDPTLTTDGKIDPASIKVAFGFRNGTSVDDTLTYWPLFDDEPLGDPNSMVIDKFLTKMQGISVSSVGQWCSLCNSDNDFCTPLQNNNNNNQSPTGSDSSGNQDSGKKSMNPAVAGVIGAIIMLAIVSIFAAVAFCFFGVGVKRDRRRSSGLSNFSIGRSQPKEKITSEIELPLSPTAAPMPRGFGEDNEFDYGTSSTVATKVASPLASPEEAHFKGYS
ncbi:hypothetical protein H072_6891 [Dactylellina haptotyla CBS 200.50]|uniref:Histidine acid phosphatase n=1 Tax=Dactylellina haptotyla (strain CBS 200.50) TaxID=1284197 RepID=S8AE37_DACHA|nr:hypothetical protein H072_6891 [Dactylellina haptotyla CBS 200.50]